MIRCIRPPAITALFLSACQGIPVSESERAREELEVAVEVAPQIARVLHPETDVEALQQVVAEAVLELADVGLRFYPVPASDYEEGQQRPTYLLSVELLDLGARLAGTTQSPLEIKASSSEIASVRCTTVATLVRRRGDGPPLIVGKSLGHGQASVHEAAADLSSVQVFELHAPDRFVLPPRLSSADLRASVREAVRESLRRLIQPIERERATD